MALGIPPLPCESWGHWPQLQPPAADYARMVEAGMVPYDGGYAPYRLPPMPESPFRPLERGTDPQIQGLLTASPSVGRSSTPSIKSEGDTSSTKSTASDSSTSSKAIVPNMRVDGAPVHEFNTPMDNLVRLINDKLMTITGSEKAEEQTQGTENKIGREDKPKRRSQARDKPKPFSCDIPGCNKTFAQKNNLETHRRAHTGESPFGCRFCRERFTQGVNAKTHHDRHIGERPYKCPKCPKDFPQRGNLKAHMRTHENRERFVCRFRDCNKTFSAKGNLKSHQNRFHVQDAIDLMTKLSTATGEDSITEEEKQLAIYVATTHVNANKGIKGRGKGRKVQRIAVPQPLPLPLPQFQPAVSSPTSGPTPHVDAYALPLLATHGLPQLHNTPPPLPQQQQPPPTVHHPFYGLSNVAAAASSSSMSRPLPPPTDMQLFDVGFAGVVRGDAHAAHHHHHHHHHAQDGGYASMMDVDGGPAIGHGPAPHAGMHVVYEDDEQERELAFGERLY